MLYTYIYIFKFAMNMALVADMALNPQHSLTIYSKKYHYNM